MIDILPYGQKKTIRRLRYMRMATGVLGGVIVLFVVACILFLPTLQTINARSALAIEQTQRLEQSGTVTKAADVLGLVARVKAVNTKLAAPLPPSPLGYIERIRAHEIPGITLTGYQINDAAKPSVVVHGVSATRDNLQVFLANVQADPDVAGVDSPVENFVKSLESEFSITVTFKTS